MNLSVEFSDDQRAAIAADTLDLLVGLRDRLLDAPAAVSIEEAGRQLAISRSTVKRLIDKGDLQTVSWSSGSTRIPQWQIWALVGDPRLAAWTDPDPTNTNPPEVPE